MNIRALIKTITPNPEFLVAIVVLILIVIALGAGFTALAVGVYYGLAYLFGELIADVAMEGAWVLFAFYIIVVIPLIERYKLIKWEMERE